MNYCKDCKYFRRDLFWLYFLLFPLTWPLIMKLWAETLNSGKCLRYPQKNWVTGEDEFYSAMSSYDYKCQGGQGFEPKGGKNV